jgi:hypothetical protein
MRVRRVLKTALKRGALVSAANWQVVLIQFVAESLFKLLLAVPLVGGALLVVTLADGGTADILSGDLRQIVTTIAGVLRAQPVALGAFLASLAIAVGGGSTLMFFVKGGTVTVLIAGDSQAGPIEQQPVTIESVRRASAFSVGALLEGSDRLFKRYLRAGLVLLTIYAVSGAMYLGAVVGGYRLVDGTVLLVGWTLIATVVSGAMALWITLVNLLYLLTQIVIAVDDVPVVTAFRRVSRFVRREPRKLAGVFLIVLALVVLALFASVLTTAGLGLIGFVPVFWLMAFPLQAAAWLVRGLVFQYLGLTALGAYLTLYRAEPREAVDGVAAAPGPLVQPA